MKNRYFFGFLFMFGLLAAVGYGQKTVVINNPLKSEEPAKLSAADEELIKTNVLPKIRPLVAQAVKDETCNFEFQPVGIINGAFSKPNSSQTLVFFHVCLTGNGMGQNGLVLIENGKISAAYFGEGGWASDIKVLPDINHNGLNEAALYYSDGMHQAQSATAVDVWELPQLNLKEIGAFQSDTYNQSLHSGYRITVKTGKTPLFYRERFDSDNDRDWTKLGRLTKFSLRKNASQLSILK